MSLYDIAGLKIQMDHIGEITRLRSQKYLAVTGSQADISINPTPEEFHLILQNNPALTLDEADYIQTGYMFACRLLDFSGFCLHASAIAIDNKAILFSAPCGTGKSTHTRLWQEYYGKDRVTMINDDKPAIRLINGVLNVFGTPWSGKDDSSSNIRVPLHAVVFLEQAKVNRICPQTKKESIRMLLNQSIRARVLQNNLLDMLDCVLSSVEIFKLGCTVSPEAVKVASAVLLNRDRLSC
jgi:hypothetical protein